MPWTQHQKLPRVYKPSYLLTKDPIEIPLEKKQGKLIDPRIEDYPSTSPSWVDSSELSELDKMLRAQLEMTTTTSTTDRSTEETTATQGITHSTDDSIGAT